MLDLSMLRSEQSPSERRSARRYVVEIGAATVVYIALLCSSLRVVERLAGVEKIVVAVAPALGAALMAVAIVRFALRSDELQRRTFVDAAAIAAVVTAVATMAMGFLENADVPRISMTYVFPLLVICWGLALPFVRRRYQ